MPGAIHEEGKLKRNHALSLVVVLLALLLTASATGCSLVQQESTTTAGSETTTTTLGADATPADRAIAALTKSAAIQTPQVIKAGVLLVGSDLAFPPLEFTDKNKNPLGFDVDLCTAIAKKLGLQLEVVLTEYRDLVSGLIDGKTYDMIMSGLAITSTSSAEISFSDAYLPTILSITTPVGSPIADAAGLAGKIVGVQTGTAAQAEAGKVSGIQQIRAYDRVLDAFDDLTKGKLDAVVTDQPTTAYVLDKWPEPLSQDKKGTLAATGSIDTGTGYGYAVKKDNAALLTAINTALTELRTEEVYKLICDKWGVTGN
jgi:polar amino acid transport system substrate-binding protein